MATKFDFRVRQIHEAIYFATIQCLVPGLYDAEFGGVHGLTSSVHKDVSALL